MLMPVRFNVNTTPAPNIATQTVQTQQTVVSEQPETTENIVQTAPIQKPQLLQKATVIWDRIIYNRMNILAYVWLIGAIALMLLNVVRYVRLNIKIRKNQRGYILPRNKSVHRQENQCSCVGKCCVTVYNRYFQTNADFAENRVIRRTIRQHTAPRNDAF